jgi:hypothetical protein
MRSKEVHLLERPQGLPTLAQCFGKSDWRIAVSRKLATR